MLVGDTRKPSNVDLRSAFSHFLTQKVRDSSLEQASIFSYITTFLHSLLSPGLFQDSQSFVKCHRHHSKVSAETGSQNMYEPR
jgi:hypothetical protein